MPPTSAPSPSGARRTPCWARRWGKNVQWSMKAWSRNRSWGDLPMKFKTFVLRAESLWSWRGSADSWSNGGYHPFWEDPYWMGAEYHLLPLQGQGCRPCAMKLLRPQMARPGHKGSREDGWELPTTTNAHQWHAIWPLAWTQHHRCHIHCMPVTRIVPCHQHETVHGLCQSGILHH